VDGQFSSIFSVGLKIMPVVHLSGSKLHSKKIKLEDVVQRDQSLSLELFHFFVSHFCFV
jgi:hypothetical protein